MLTRSHCWLSLRLCVIVNNMPISYSEELFAPHQTPNLEANSLPTFCSYLFNIFIATLHIYKPSHPSAIQGCAMPIYHLNYFNSYFYMGLFMVCFCRLCSVLNFTGWCSRFEHYENLLFSFNLKTYSLQVLVSVCVCFIWWETLKALTAIAANTPI